MPKILVDENMTREEKYGFCEHYCRSCPNFHNCISEERCVQPAIKKYFLKGFREGIKNDF